MIYINLQTFIIFKLVFFSTYCTLVRSPLCRRVAGSGIILNITHVGRSTVAAITNTETVPWLPTLSNSNTSRLPNEMLDTIQEVLANLDD